MSLLCGRRWITSHDFNKMRPGGSTPRSISRQRRHCTAQPAPEQQPPEQPQPQPEQADQAVSVSNLRFRSQQQQQQQQQPEAAVQQDAPVQGPVQYVDEFPAELEGEFALQQAGPCTEPLAPTSPSPAPLARTLAPAGLTINEGGMLVDEKTGKVIRTDQPLHPPLLARCCSRACCPASQQLGAACWLAQPAAGSPPPLPYFRIPAPLPPTPLAPLRLPPPSGDQRVWSHALGRGRARAAGRAQPARLGQEQRAEPRRAAVVAGRLPHHARVQHRGQGGRGQGGLRGRHEADHQQGVRGARGGRQVGAAPWGPPRCQLPAALRCPLPAASAALGRGPPASPCVPCRPAGLQGPPG
jgi:hypothetical protein